MSRPSDPSQQENPYFIDPESGAEMARLMDQDRLMTKGMGGLFSERSDLSTMHRLLDIGCGPGGWALEVAYAYPEIEVVGIDISHTMVEYARAQARVQGLDNAHFRVMDATKPLDFPSAAFDLVNGRLLVGFMPKGAWPRLIGECLRISRPGGVIRLTEAENWGITNSPAYEQLNALATRALQRAGSGFSPDGRNIGITPMLGRFLRDAGCQQIQHRAHAIDYSAGTEVHAGWYQDFLVSFKLLQPFLIKMGGTTQEEVERHYQQALVEMLQDDFRAIWYFLTVWGQKP